MKLYLSSYKIPNLQILLDLVTKPVEKVRLGFIINAKDTASEPIRTEKLERFERELGELGFQHVARVDLNRYQGVQQLHDTLDGFDVLFALGGSSYDVMMAIRRSGFNDYIGEYLAAGGVYAGDSASAMVAGSSLLGYAEDDSHFVDSADATGLRLVDKFFVPHADSDNLEYVARAEHVRESSVARQAIILNDNEVYVVDGDKHYIAQGNSMQLPKYRSHLY